MKKKILVFLFDGFSDWELAYLTPEINKSEKCDHLFISETGDSITSMGGLNIKPAAALKDINPDSIDMLILPGGEAWEKNQIHSIEGLTTALFKEEKLIAAICAATTFLGQLGLLDGLNHTSNDLNYLKAIAPQYKGDNHYKNEFAITDRNLITANGIAPIEFAREIFKAIELYDDEGIEKWFQLFKNGVWSE